MRRQSVIQHVAEQILCLSDDSVARVGIDGDAGAGKTLFGDELESALRGNGRPIIRASVDAFHNPREIRYRLGKNSPDGFFLDSYDYAALSERLLDPLSPGGSRRFRREAFDHRTNSAVAAAEEYAEPHSILILDGIFLHRRELSGYWDYSVYLDVCPATGLFRCASRGDGSPDPLAESNYRYVEGQKRYLTECRPKERATVVIDNEDPENPQIIPK